MIKLYSENKNYKLYQGNMLEMLDVIQPNSIDSIITDPPYELNFMNNSWDNSGIAFQKETWEKCLKVLKPGGYLLAFGGSRTFHRIACAIEDAGFEIRDTIMWLYGSGFPKSLNIGLAIDKKNGVESKKVGLGRCGTNAMLGGLKGEITNIGSYDIKEAQNNWKGWGTQLKPSYEPIIVGRKPVEKTIVDNVLKYGVGGINIDECRVEANDDLYRKPCENGSIYSQKEKKNITGTMNDSYLLGRFPANTILTYDETDFDEFNDSGSATRYFKNCPYNKTDYYDLRRYYYQPKASRKDRDEGLDDFEEQTVGSLAGGENDKDSIDDVSSRFRTLKKNIHPTVKPVMKENKENHKNYKYIGIELATEYLPIAKARIEYYSNDYKKRTESQNTIYKEYATNIKYENISLF